MPFSDEHRAPSAPPLQGPRIVLMLSVFALLLLGLVMVYSTSSVTLAGTEASPMASLLNQALWAVVGIVAALILWRVPYSVWIGTRLVWAIWGVGILLLFATWIFGDDADMGAKRWLYIGSFSMQPSEFVKIAFLMVFVRILADYHAGAAEWRASVVKFFFMVLVPLAFLYKTQSDLGTSLIIAACIFAVAWLGGVSGKVLAGVAGAGIVFVLYAIFGTDYRSGRMVFLNPWDDGEGGYGNGFNLIRSLYAIAEGGILGVGLGNSHEKYDYLFASDNDFIYAVICEELGMVGALAVVALYLAILWAGLRIASETDDELGSLLVGGCAIMLCTQAFLNIGSTIGLLPTTGKPLPFISSGGTSLLASFLVVGLMLSVSNAPSESAVYERRRADLRIIRATGADGASAARSARSGRGELPRSDRDRSTRSSSFGGRAAKDARASASSRSSDAARSARASHSTRSSRASYSSSRSTRSGRARGRSSDSGRRDLSSRL